VLIADLVLTYKILFGYVDLDINLFEFGCTVSTCGHFKLYKHRTNHCIINFWNLLQVILISEVFIVRSSLRFVDFTLFLKCS